MAVTCLVIEDTQDGHVKIKVTCDTPISENADEVTLSQLLAAQLYEGMSKYLAEQAPSV
jgi:pyoverdine/dityrosine biosynthesis protein Dit1